MRSQFERFIQRIWYGESVLAWLLLPFSWAFGLLVTLRRQAYRAGWLRMYSSPVPVIIVGNISVGGTGKTPLVAWLVDRLRAQGLRPGIVSRGYAGRTIAQSRIIAADDSAEAVGDEPLLLMRKTGVPVCIGTDRVAAVEQLCANADVDIIVADDGLQHYRLHRDAELIVVDGPRGFGNGFLLPAGPLRESRSRLQQGGLVISNGPCATLQCLSFTLQPGQAKSLDGRHSRPLASFSGKKAWAVAGIGNPERFYTLLAEHGIDYEVVAVADHGRVDLGKLNACEERPVLMTEKDAVKYPAGTADVWQIPVTVGMPAETVQVIDDTLQQRIPVIRPA